MTSNGRVHKREAFSLLDMIGKVKNKSGFQKAGAIAMFIGVVRGETLQGEKVQKLMLEAYEENANEVLAKICSDLKKKPGIVDVQIHHLLGEFSVSEDLVYVLIAGSHRRNVFPVLEEAVERYKREVPIFKKEYVLTDKGEERAYWVEESEGDA